MAQRYIKLELPDHAAGKGEAGAFSVSASGLTGTQKQYRRGNDDSGVYIAPAGQGSISPPLGTSSKTFFIEAEDNAGNAIRKEVTLTGSTAITAAIDPVETNSGGRPAAVPTAYYNYIADEAVDTNTHPVSDPFASSCSIYTHKAVKSGNWSDPTVWNTGTTPHSATDGTAIVCTSTYDVVYDVESDVRIKDIHVNHHGSLSFATTKTRLWVDTIMVDGRLKIGDVSNPIPDSGSVSGGARVPQCEIVFWASEAPGITTRLGIATMGPVRIHGEAKAHKTSITTDALAGATSVTIPDIASLNWKVGDELLFVATEYQGTSATDASYTGPTTFYGRAQGANQQLNQTMGFMKSGDDVRRIVSIVGTTVTLSSALEFDHKVYTRTLKRGQVVTIPVYIGNMTRSIVFRSATSTDTAIWADADVANLQKRAHTMFMHSDDVEVRFFETRDMARTDTNPTLVRPGQGNTLASNGGAVITNPLNVRGRYSVHFHGNGPYNGRKIVVAEGVVCKGQIGPALSAIPQPGWSLVHHNAKAAVDRCITYNSRGAGIVSETGIELGQWIDNISAWNRGDAFMVLQWGTRHEQWTNHNGHAGVGFESQSRQILQQHNISSSSHICWLFYQQDAQYQFRIPDQFSLRFRDPLCMGSGLLTGPDEYTEYTYGLEQAQIPDFNDNTCLASRVGFGVGHREFTDRYDNTPMISKRFNCVNVNTAFFVINYTFHYHFYDFVWIGKAGGGSEGASLGNVSWVLAFYNGFIDNMSVGIRNAGTGLNAGGFFVDLLFDNCTLEYTHSTAGWDTTLHPPEDCPLNGCMGPWEVVSGSSMMTRRFVTLDSDTDVPTNLPIAGMGPDDKDPLPGTPKPYFVLNPGADVTHPGLVLSGVIVDKLGARKWPFAYSSESFQWSHTGTTPTKAEGNSMTMTRIVQRNGCFYNAAGVLKSRLWIIDLERLYGDYFLFYIDISITGVASDIIAANIVDPWSAAPAVPIAIEATPATALPSTNTNPSVVRSLSLSALSFPADSAPGVVVGTITRSTAGSTITLTNDDGGRFTLSGNDIVTGSVASAAGARSIQLTETLSGALNSGRVSTVALTAV